MVLVQLGKHRRDEPLSESIVQSIVDHLRSDTEPSGTVPVDDESRLKSLVLLVAGDIAQFRQRLKLFDQSRRPCTQFIGIRILQAVLKLSAAHAIVNREILDRLHEERNAFDSLQLRLQSPDNV